MLTSYDIIKKPVITEKSTLGIEEKKYTFRVAKTSNKVQIKKAVEEIFKVKVEKVTTLNCIGKKKKVGKSVGKRSDWKKAMVKLSKDSKTIEIFDGIN